MMSLLHITVARGDSNLSQKWFHHRFRHQGHVIETHPSSILNRIQYRRRRAVHRQPANSLRSSWPIRVRILFEEDANRGNVRGSWHDVVSHLSIGHAAVLPDNFLEEREPDRLRHATFDLSGGQHWIDHP